MYDMGIAMGGIVSGRIASAAPLAAIYWTMAVVGGLGMLVFAAGKRFTARAQLRTTRSRMAVEVRIR